MKNGLVCWCEDCEEKFYYDDTTKHDTHCIWKLYERKNGKKVIEQIEKLNQYKQRKKE